MFACLFDGFAVLGLRFVCNGALIVLLLTFLPCGLERCIVLILVRHWLVLVGGLVYCLVEMLVVLYFVCWLVGVFVGYCLMLMLGCCLFVVCRFMVQRFCVVELIVGVLQFVEVSCCGVDLL